MMMGGKWGVATLGKESNMSIGWLITVFIVGGYAGMLLMALMQAAARRERTFTTMETLAQSGLSPLDVATHNAAS